MATNNRNEGAAQKQSDLNKREELLIKYRKQIIAAVVAVIVIIAGYVIYKTAILEPRQEKASTAIAKAQEAFTQGDYQTALNGNKSQEGFLAVTENYSGTDAANLAKLYAGLCYANMGKWADAVKFLDDYSTQGDALISPAATAALGNAYANTGNVDKAITTLKKAASMADSKAENGINNSLSPTYLIQAARLLESQGKKEDALKIYEEVKKKYVNSAASQDIDKYIERLTK